MGGSASSETRRLIVSGYTQSPDSTVSKSNDSGATDSKNVDSDNVNARNHSSLASGVCVFEFDSQTASVTPVCENVKVESPSFCQMVGDRLYAASETPDHGGLAFFALDDGCPVYKDDIDFPHAAGTCYVLTHPNGKHIYGADYNSGSVSVGSLKKTGDISRSIHLIQHEGHSAPRDKDDPNFDRQLSAHVHTLSIVPGTDLLATVDLGLDLIVLYQMDEDGNIVSSSSPRVPSDAGTLSSHEGASLSAESGLSSDVNTSLSAESGPSLSGENAAWELKRSLPGSNGGEAIARLPLVPAGIVEIPLHKGPRIVAYHPTLPLAALICELSCELLIYSISADGLTWTLLSQHDLLEGLSESDLNGAIPLAAHCAFSDDGHFLYASTRGPNIMTTFSVSESGNLSKLFVCSSGSATPRHFALSPDERFVAVANQTGNDVSLFEREVETGKLALLTSFDIETPSCVVWE